MVSTEEKNEMKRLRAILDSGFDGSVHSDPEIPFTETPNTDGKIAPPALSSARDPQMAKFLAITEGFTDTAEKSAQSLQESNDPEIREALNTNHSDDSISIGNWKIKIVERPSYSKKNIKTYDIINNLNNQVIVEGLYIYEAARGLVRLLNKGIPLNQTSPQHIIQLEAKYVALRDDLYRAMKKRIKLREEGHLSQSGIYKARAEDYQEKAFLTKKQIIEASNNALRLLR